MDTGTINQLAAFAERFCAVIDEHARIAPDDFLHAVHLHLARLYLGGPPAAERGDRRRG